MRNTKYLKVITAIFMVMIMSINTAVIFASATEDNLTEVVANGYYRHPITGIIEDSGGESSSALGQSMVSSVAPTVAMLEEVDGKYYVTFAFNLMNSISNVEFQVQERDDSDWETVSHEIVSTGDDIETFKIEIPAADAIVRASAFVVPMGRSVVFYMDFIESDASSSLTDTTTDSSTDTTTSSSTSSSSSDFDSLIASADDVITSYDITFSSDETSSDEESSSSTDETSESLIIDDSVWLILLAYIFCGNVLSGTVLIVIYMLIKKAFEGGFKTTTKTETLNFEDDSDEDSKEDSSFDDFDDFDDLDDLDNQEFTDVWSDTENEDK
ncbi:MAG: heme-binding Shp domain-containing protein [Clostridia bacterium]